MKKAVAVVFLLALTLVTFVGCADSHPSDYAGMVDTSGVLLPENVFVEDRVSEEENPTFREAVLRQGRATVSDTFSITAVVKTEPEVTEENRAEEAYERLIANSAFVGEPADQDLFLYRYTYKLCEEAKATGGMELEDFCLMKYGLSFDEYREMLSGNLRELLVVTAFCEQNGIFYTEADRERLLDGAVASLFPADEYELQFSFYRNWVIRLLSEENHTEKSSWNIPMQIPAFSGNLNRGG